MSKHYLIVGIATVAAGIMIWISLRDNDAHSDAPTLSAAAVDGHSSSAVPAAEAIEDALPTLASTSISQPKEHGPMELRSPADPLTAPGPQSQVDDYLSKHGRDARSLLQAFRTGKNRDYLNEALKRFPDDPMVLFHCVSYDADPTEERKAILRRLQELLPADAVPSYLLGEQLLQEGDDGAALELLMAGSLKPHANNYAAEIISDSQDFLEASGVPPADALAQACCDLELRLVAPMRNLMSLVSEIHADISSKGDGEENANTWAIVGSRIAQSMHNQRSLYLIDELVTIGAEKHFLSLLPPETELVAGGMTVTQRSKEIEEFLARVRSLPLTAEDALTLTAENKMLFFKKLQNESEISALLWLNRVQETVIEEQRK